MLERGVAAQLVGGLWTTRRTDDPRQDTSRDLHAAHSPPAFPTVLALDSTLPSDDLYLIRIQIARTANFANLHPPGIHLPKKYICITSWRHWREHWAVGRRPG